MVLGNMVDIEIRLRNGMSQNYVGEIDYTCQGRVIEIRTENDTFYYPVEMVLVIVGRDRKKVDKSTETAVVN